MFVIQCTTCRTRLKVHDPRLVGDIVECPKCGSFVELTPPAGWQSAVVAPTPPKQTSTVPPSTVEASALLRTPPPLPLQGTTSGVGKSSVPAATSTSNLIVPDLPSDSTWFARGIGQLRNHWFLAVCGFTGGVVAATVLSFMLSSSTPNEPDPVGLIKSSRPQTIFNTPEMADNSTEVTVTDTNKGTVTEESSEKVDEVPETNRLASPSDAADENRSETAAPSLSLSASDENQHDSVFEDDSQPSSLNNRYEDSVKLNQKDIIPTDVSAIESSEERHLDPAKQAQMLAHFQDKLPTVEFNNVGLGQFVAFLTAYSTVPITLDTESLFEVGKSAKTRVSVKLTNTTVEAALKTALTRPGLTFHVEPGRVVITAAQSK